MSAVSESPGADRTLEDLLERVKGATKGDPELDAAIYNALPQMDDAEAFRGIDGEYRKRVRDWPDWGPFPLDDFTASIDAAVHLCERVLPGWRWYAANNPGYGAMIEPETDRWVAECNAATPALALLAALLEALVKSRSPSLVG